MSKQQFNVMSVQEIEELDNLERIELRTVEGANEEDALCMFSLALDELN